MCQSSTKAALLPAVALILLTMFFATRLGYADTLPPPNILLLVAEDLSPRIGAWGDSLADTPNINRLAADGTRFTRVFTTAGVCAPSRAALITGQHQISFGAQHMRTTTGPLGPYLAQPPMGVKAFPELMRANGYFTFTDRKLDYQFSGVGAGSGPFTLWDLDNAPDTAWRNKSPQQPFFGLINFLETHESGLMRMDVEPYSPSHKATQQMRKALGMIAPSQTDPAQVELEPYYPDLPQVRADIARHYDNIHAMDQRVGHILEALATDGLLETTIIIWTTDHGDGLPRAKRELYDSGIHVPLLLHIPKMYQNLAMPSEDSRLVSFVDLAPTVLDLAGIPRPEYLHGKSILSSTRSYIYAARDRIDEVPDRQRAVRDTRFKYIHSWYPDTPGGHALAYRDNLDMVKAWRTAWQTGQTNATQSRWFESPGEDQLYDLQRDPFELTNLADDPEYLDTLARMQDALRAFLKRVGDTAEQPEEQMRNAYLLDGKRPITPPPEVSLASKQIVLHSSVGASIGYRLAGETRWRLYTGPLKNRPLSAKAVRYGWQESPVVEIP